MALLYLLDQANQPPILYPKVVGLIRYQSLEVVYHPTNLEQEINCLLFYPPEVSHEMVQHCIENIRSLLHLI